MPFRFAALLIAIAFLALPARAQDEPVDLELILLIDASGSISDNVLEFQLRGHAAALRDEGVASAIVSGPTGAIAVMVAAFSGPNSLQVLAPWTKLSSAGDIATFADKVENAPRDIEVGATAIGNAIRDSLALFEDNGYDALQRTIDLTSNGFANAGLDPALARDLAEQNGVTINALAILNEYDWLEFYYRQSVIGGVGAFVRTAKGPETFTLALIQKLIDEMVRRPAGSQPSLG